MESGPETRTGDLTEQVRQLTQRVYSLEQQVASLRKGNAGAAPVEVPTVPPPFIQPRETSPAVAPPKEIPLPFVRLQSDRSLENKIGSQLFNRIGVLAILVGAAWGLKLAIDNRLIGEMGRIVLGLLAGCGIVLWSERFRRKGYPVFSYSLKAVGSGVLYLSLWAGFQLYHLMPSGVAFAAMLLVTAWNAWMAWSQDAELLAAYALAGGFATPSLISTGQNHPVILFSYLIALSVAVVGLIALKPWQRLLAGAMPAMVLYYIGWYTRFYTADQFSLIAFFTAILFLLFAAVPLVRSMQQSTILTIFAPLAAGAFGSLAFYSLLQDSGLHGVLPWGAAAFGAFYLGLMRLQSRLRPNAASEAIHLTLAIVFLTIAIPLKASGRWITIGWLAEGVALFWVATTRVSDAPPQVGKTLRLLSIGALALGYAGAMTLPLWTHASDTPFFNSRFATQIFAIVVLGGVIYLDRQSEQKNVAAVSSVALNLLILTAMRREIFAMFSAPGADSIAAEFATSAFWMLHGAALLGIGFWKRAAFIRWQGLILLIATIAKVFLYDMRSLSQGYRVLSFIGLGALLMAVSFAYQKDWLALKNHAGHDAAGSQAPDQESQG